MMRRLMLVTACAAGLVLGAGPAFAQAIPTPILPTPPTQGNVAPVPTPQTGLPTPGLLPPPIVGPVPALTPSSAPTPAPSNLPVPLNVPHPEIGNGSVKPPTIPGVNDPGPPPNNDAAVCTASWYNFYGKAVCSMVNQAHKDTASTLKLMGITLKIPDITNNAEFQTMYSMVWPVADGLLALLFVYGCVLVIAGEWTYFEAKQLVPRLALASAGANLTIPILSYMIKTSNSIVNGILTVSPSSLQPNGSPETQGTAFFVLGVFLLFVALASLIINLVAWAVLGIGAGFGGLANVFYVTEKTDDVARHWWRLVFWLCLSPVLQAFCLVLLVQVFLNSSDFNSNGVFFDTAQRAAVLLVYFAVPLICLKKALSGKKMGKVIKAAYVARKLVTGGLT
jgi:hypothetical protein